MSKIADYLSSIQGLLIGGNPDPPGREPKPTNDSVEDVRRLLRQQEALATFGSFALRQNDLLSVLNEAARVCAEGLGAPFCKICRYRADKNDLLIEAGHGWQTGVVGHVVSRSDTTSPQGRAFVTGEPSICEDLRKDHGFQLPPFYGEHGILSTIDVIIKGSVEPYGVLEIDSDVQHNYGKDDIHFLTGFANVLAEAVATASRNAALRVSMEQMQVLARDKDHLLEQKQALTEELTDFAHIASHDLAAPLRAIRQLAGWIEQDIRAGDSDETAEHLRLLQQRTTRLEMLLAGLLAYSRVGHAEASAEPVDIAEMVTDIVHSLRPPLGFIVRFEGQTLIISTPAAPLEHVLQNLIANAIKHHDRAIGQVIVSACVIDDMVEVHVADDGPGIAPQHHKSVFDIFKTLVGRDEREAGGVGLSIVRKAVERAGGEIRIDSDPPRRGATFIFTWPLARKVAQSNQDVPA